MPKSSGHQPDFWVKVVDMLQRQDPIATLAFSLRQSRPLLRRIAAEKHPSPTDLLDPAMMAAEQILRQLELSGYEVRRKDRHQRPHSTP